MPNVLLLTRYERLAASSRVRFLQYLPALRDQGFTFDVEPLLSNAYVASLYGGPRIGVGPVLAAYARRVRTLLGRRGYDLLWIEKELLPWCPWWIDAMLSRGVPSVVDYDDAWFLRYNDNRHAMVRMLLRDKIETVMRHATIVVAGNGFLAAHAKDAGAKDVRIVPTVIDLDRYPVPAGRSSAGSTAQPLTIGWIGSPLNTHYLALIAPALRKLASEGPVRIVIVGGAAPDALAGLPVESVPWSEQTEVRQIERFDIGIMPLADTPWERGKCAFKLLQVMALAKPVVGSDVGANRDVVSHGSNGFLAATMEEWADAMRRLRDDPDLRGRLGAQARRTVEAGYSLDGNVPKIAAALRAAGAGKPAGG